MSLIVLEGPEKAGKTTFANKLREVANIEFDIDARYVHHKYGDTKMEIIGEEIHHVLQNPNVMWIYDRWYLSEFVYSDLCDREKTFEINSHVAEELIGKWIDDNGARFILTQPTPILKARRDETDLPVDPYDEIVAYLAYGMNWKHLFITNDNQMLDWCRYLSMNHLTKLWKDPFVRGEEGYYKVRKDDTYTPLW